MRVCSGDMELVGRIRGKGRKLLSCGLEYKESRVEDLSINVTKVKENEQLPTTK